MAAKVKKILLVTQYFNPEHFVVNQLAVSLVARGYQVEVLTGLPNYPKGVFAQGYSFWRGPWRENYHGVQVVRVPLLARGQGFKRLALNYLSFVLFGIVPGVFRIQHDYDVIFCMGLSPVTSCLPAIVMKWWSRKPLVFWVQDLWPESVAAVGAARNSRIVNAIGYLVRFIYRQCDLILIQSQAFRENILRWGGQSIPVALVPNWAKSLPRDGDLPTWLQNLPQGFRIVFAGNIGKAQDLPVLIEAAKILKSSDVGHLIKWIIVGDGSEKAFVESQVIKWNLEDSIFLYGRRPPEDMGHLCAQGDLMYLALTDEPIFALTVPSRVQGFMAAGKPIVAAINGEGQRVIVEAGAGKVAPAGDSKRLAELIREFVRMSPEERKAFGQGGRKYFEEYFDEELVIGQIEKHLCEVRLNQQDKKVAVKL